MCLNHFLWNHHYSKVVWAKKGGCSRGVSPLARWNLVIVYFYSGSYMYEHLEIFYKRKSLCRFFISSQIWDLSTKHRPFFTLDFCWAVRGTKMPSFLLNTLLKNILCVVFKVCLELLQFTWWTEQNRMGSVFRFVLCLKSTELDDICILLGKYKGGGKHFQRKYLFLGRYALNFMYCMETS